MKKTGQRGNDYSGVACWWPKSVTKGLVWSKQVHPILVKNIWGKNQGTQSKDTWLPRDGFGLFITRGGVIINDKIFTEVPRWFTRRVASKYDHSRIIPSVTNKRWRGNIVLKEYWAKTFHHSVAQFYLWVQDIGEISRWWSHFWLK